MTLSGTARPTPEQLTAALLRFIEREPDIRLDAFESDWRASGVYAVLDCVFSSAARFEAVVVPTLARFGQRSGLRDEPELTFAQFLDFVRGGLPERPTPERFEEVAAAVFGNRQRIAGRTKVEVAYDVCEFFALRGHQTKADLRALPAGTPPSCKQPGEPGELERLVMEQLVGGSAAQGKVRGMGWALGPYLLMCLGHTDCVKPDTLLLRLIARVSGTAWRPGSGGADFRLIRQALGCVGERLGYPPAAVDHALWRHESARAARQQHRPAGPDPLH